MEHSPRLRPDRRRRIRLGLLWGAALLVTTVLAVIQLPLLPFLPRGETLVTGINGELPPDGSLQPWERWLWETWWAWTPLAGAAIITALTSARAHRRWPRRARRIQLGLACFLGLVALVAAVGTSRALLLLVLGAFVALLVTWVVVVPRRLAPPLPAEELERLGDRDRLDVTDARVRLQNELRTTALQAIAGLAILAGAVLGFQQLTEDRQQATASRTLTLQGQASERFTRAVDQLTSDRVEIQLGGIYGLEQIARQAPDNRLAVTEVLAAYVHRRAQRPAKPPSGPPAVHDQDLRTRLPDVQAAVTVLGRRRITLNDPRLNLRALDLGRADLRGVFSDLDLCDPAFANAYLDEETNIGGADLSNADLRGADLSGATLCGSILTGVDLSGATLDGVHLNHAELTNANFSGADLSNAGLLDADLSGADLSGAVLRGAFLNGADLRRAELSGAVLAGAWADEQTKWPVGFDPSSAGVQQF